MTPVKLNVVGLLLLLCLVDLGAATAADRVDFNFQIRPLLSDRCFRCHGPDAGSRKARLRLDTEEGARKELDDGWAVIKPGDPDRSELIRRIYTDDEDDLMPPPDSHLTLTAAEKALLKRWVLEGAEYQPHWAFRPVGKITPPTPRDSSWVRNPVDAFVRSHLEGENFAPAPEAPREILIRRLALGLTGLPPTPAELDQFLADTSPAVYERIVGHYLNSPAYGERMALDWLDLARYADTYGYQNDVDRDMSPWRDWVIRAFNENLSYDQFITWQLAGDLLPHPNREQRLATAFNRLHRQTNEGGSIDEEFRTEYAADRLHTVGTAMLGLTLECARCHDHKFDPISQRDYYALFAFFNNIDESGTYSHFTRATPSPAMLLWTEDKEKQHAELTNNILAAEANVAARASSSQPEFLSWLEAGGQVSLPQPIAHFPFDTVISNTTPDRVTGTNFARLVDEPTLVAAGILPAVEPGFQPGGKKLTADQAVANSISVATATIDPGGNLPPSTAGGMPAATNFALQFNGDNFVTCRSVPNFKRTDAFSFALFLKPTEKQDRAVILHQSRAWTDAGSRGFELTLDHGKPFFGLIHFWPGNAIAIRAKQEVPLNDWSHLTVTYNGSSRAAGIQIYLNGSPLETEVIRDQLYKDIVHRSEWGDMEVGKVHLQLAGRFRDSGFKNGVIDDLQVFDMALTAAEVAAMAERGVPAPRDSGAVSQRAELEFRAPATFEYFLARHHEPYRAAHTELARLREQENALINDIPEIMIMQKMSVQRVTHLLNRGAYNAPGDVVQRDTPAAVRPFPNDQPRDRLGLARWMVDGQNPLTARVTVNRVWQMHFGRGLVGSPEDFGSQGRLPTHPELLDWLAGWFVQNGWDMKALHRLIVTSATYRQSAHAPRELRERDPDNTLLTRGPQQRLPAEIIRDSALAASGLLVRTRGGPSVKPYQPAGLWEATGTGKSYTQDTGEKLYRRSLYTFWKRTAPPPAMLTLDAVTREVCTARRETTATPLQALVLLNDPQFVEAARALGEQLLKRFPGDETARHREAFRALTGRSPDETEAGILARLFAEQKEGFVRNTEAARNLLSTGESPWDESLPPADFAALTVLVNAIMNFDEFVMQR